MPQNPSSCFMVPGPGILFFKGLMAVGSSELSLSFIRCLLLDKYQSLVAPTPPCSLCFFLFFFSALSLPLIFCSTPTCFPARLLFLSYLSAQGWWVIFYFLSEWERERERGEGAEARSCGPASVKSSNNSQRIHLSIQPARSGVALVIKLACSLRCRGDGRGAGGRLMFYLCLSLLTRKRQKKLTGYWRDWDPG